MAWLSRFVSVGCLLAPVVASFLKKALKDKSNANESKNAAESKNRGESKNGAGQGNLQTKFDLNSLLNGKDSLSEEDRDLLFLLVDTVGKADLHAGTYISRWSHLFKSIRGLFDDAKNASEEEVAKLRLKVACVLLAPCLLPESAQAQSTKLQQMCVDLQALDGALVSAIALSEALGRNIDIKYSEILLEWKLVNGAITTFSGVVVAAAGCYWENEGLTQAGAGTTIQGVCETLGGGTGLAQLRARLSEVHTRVDNLDLVVTRRQKSVGEHRDQVENVAMRLDQFQGKDAAEQAAADALRGLLPSFFKHEEVGRACASFDTLAREFKQ